VSFDLQRLIESKRAYRQHLRRLPIGEKLRLLDVMRERELALRARRGSNSTGDNTVSESATSYHLKSE
jgi:hypothetical protein